jgi:hypothetical protein
LGEKAAEGKKSAAQKIYMEYFSFHGGDFATPSVVF